MNSITNITMKKNVRLYFMPRIAIIKYGEMNFLCKSGTIFCNSDNVLIKN